MKTVTTKHGASLADSVHVAKSAASLSLMGVQDKSCLCTKETKSSLKKSLISGKLPPHLSGNQMFL